MLDQVLGGGFLSAEPEPAPPDVDTSTAGPVAAPGPQPEAAPPPPLADATLIAATAAAAPAASPAGPAGPELSVTAPPEPADAVVPPPAPVEQVTTPEELAAAVGRAGERVPAPGPRPDRASAALAPVTNRTRRGGAAPARSAQLGGRIPPPRLSDPIEIDPVPESTGRILAAVNARLPELTLPPVLSPPNGPRPQVRVPQALQDEELKREEKVPEVPTETQQRSQRDWERRRTAGERAAARTPGPEPEVSVSLDPPVLVVRPLPAPVPTPEQIEQDRANVARVVAQLLADAHREADDILMAARTEAYPEGALEANFQTLGNDDLLPPVQAYIDERMRGLATAAGVATDELEAAVRSRRDRLAGGQQTAAEQTAGAVQTTVDTAQEEARRTAATAEAAARQAERDRIRRLQAALTAHDPALVEGLRDERLRFIEADVARGVVAHEQTGRRRKDLVIAYEDAYDAAYRAADDAAQARAPAGQPRRAPTDPTTGQSWYHTAQDTLAQEMRTRREQVDRGVGALVDTLRAAGLDARAAVRDWAAQRLGQERTEDERQVVRAADASAQEQAEIQARRDAELAEARDRVLQQVRFASSMHDRLHVQDTGQAEEQAMALDEATRQVAQQYLAAGNDPADPMSAVAAHLRAEIRGEKVQELVLSLRQKVAAMRPTERTELLQLNGVIFLGTVDAEARVTKLHQGFEYTWGTEEDWVFEALGGLDEQQAHVVRRLYRIRWDEELDDRIRSEMSYSEEDRALAGARGDRVAESAATIRMATPGFFRADRNLALQAIRSLPPGQVAQLAEVYERTYNEPLESALSVALRGGHRHGSTQVDPNGRLVEDTRSLDETRALLDLNTARFELQQGRGDPARVRRLQAEADALAFDQALRRPQPEQDFEQDLSSLRAVYTHIRADVESDPRTQSWTQEQVDNEVRRRAQEMERAYGDRFGAAMDGAHGRESVLRRVMTEQLVGGERLDLAMAMADVDRTGEIAARLQLSTRGLYAADADVNAGLQANYDAALDEVHRGQRDDIQRELHQRIAERRQVGRPMSYLEIKAEERAITERLATARATARLKDVSARFADRYGDEWGGGRKALRMMVKSATQLGGENEARDRLRQGGGLTVAQRIHYSVQGWDMDTEQALAALEGRTPAEIEEAAQEYRRRWHEDMRTRLRSEAGSPGPGRTTGVSRTAFDIEEALLGTPLTEDDQLTRLRRRVGYERTTYFGGDERLRDQVAKGDLARMEDQLRMAEDQLRRLDEARTTDDTRRIDLLESSFYRQSNSVIAAVDDYRQTVDQYVDQQVQIASAVAAITAAVVITVVSGGTAAPAIVALTASLAGAATTIATRQALLGAAYSRNQLTNDMIVGSIDAVVSVLTARLGDIILRVPKPTGATQKALRAAMRRAAAQRAAKPVLQRVAAHAVEQLAQAAPTAVVGALVDRNNWRGDMFKNVALASLIEIGTGLAVGSAVSHVISHGPRLVGGAVDAIRSLRGPRELPIVVMPGARQAISEAGAPRDSPATRATPAERMAAFQAHRERFPTASMRDFLRAVDDGHAVLEVSAEQTRLLQWEMRRELLSSIPPAEHHRFAEVPVTVLSDAEFTARTGSTRRGQAAVLIVDGRPQVLVREGAPFHALREEGIHLQQIADPANATRAVLLDESRLANYRSLPLEERMVAWRAKLELEVDAQRRLLTDLEGQRVQVGDDVELRAALEQRMSDIRASRDILDERLRTLVGLDPKTRAAMAEGRVRQPPFLDDQPRLFAKAAPLVEARIEFVGDPQPLLRGRSRWPIGLRWPVQDLVTGLARTVWSERGHRLFIAILGPAGGRLRRGSREAAERLVEAMVKTERGVAGTAVKGYRVAGPSGRLDSVIVSTRPEAGGTRVNLLVFDRGDMVGGRLRGVSMATTVLQTGQSVDGVVRQLTSAQGRRSLNLGRTDNLVHALQAVRDGDFNLAKRPLPAFPSVQGVPGNNDWFAGGGGIRSALQTRNPLGEMRVEIFGRIQRGIPRVLAPSFEHLLRLASQVGLKDYRRLHLWGPGFGDEARLGIMYGPHAVNDGWQREGVEQVIRDLSVLARRYNGELELHVVADSHARSELPSPIRAQLRQGEEFLKSVRYDFTTVDSNGRVLERWKVEIDVGLPPNGRVEVTTPVLVAR